MKKLMIAAAAAAMVGGAFAEASVTNDYIKIDTKAEFSTNSVILVKSKASTAKYLNLSSAKKLFGKTVKNPTLAVDGVYYYAGNGKWNYFEWNKEIYPVIEEGAYVPKFDIYVNDATNKAYATTQPWDWYGRGPFALEVKDQLNKAVTDIYSKLSFGKDKKPDPVIKSLKTTDGYYKFSVKTFKTADKAAAFVKNSLEKAKKVAKKAENAPKAK